MIVGGVDVVAESGCVLRTLLDLPNSSCVAGGGREGGRKGGREGEIKKMT